MFRICKKSYEYVIMGYLEVEKGTCSMAMGRRMGESLLVVGWIQWLMSSLMARFYYFYFLIKALPRVS